MRLKEFYCLHTTFLFDLVRVMRGSRWLFWDVVIHLRSTSYFSICSYKYSPHNKPVRSSEIIQLLCENLTWRQFSTVLGVQVIYSDMSHTKSLALRSTNGMTSQQLNLSKPWFV